ncbi:MAG: hypothetical protein IMZ63_03520 [Actinobacteria bacterium]|nr:hypothetical protein [Actinomycetota bacterium]
MTVDYIYPRLPQIELHPILRESVSKVLQVLQQKKYVIGNHINGVKKAYRITSEGRQAFSEVEASKLRFERVVKEGKCEENN